jgi:hypothetical protein
MQRLCSGIGFEKKAMKISCDNQSEIFMEKNLDYHSNTKHIDLQYNFMRYVVERKRMLLDKVEMLENITDSLTKSASIVKLSCCREAMGIFSLGL